MIIINNVHHTECLGSCQVKLQLQTGEYQLLSRGVQLSLLLDAAGLDQGVAELGEPETFFSLSAFIDEER